MFLKFFFFQRWVHKAKRLLDLDGLSPSSSIFKKTKVEVKKEPNPEIDDNSMEANDSYK